jgi:hypothetical protein
LDNQHLQGAQKTELSKIVYSPSYVDFRSRVNIAMLLDLGHMLTGEHIREEWGSVETQNMKVFDVPTAVELIQDP